MKRALDLFLNLFLCAVALLLLWIFCQVFLLASFRIPSDSMEPGLVEGDDVWVWKPTLGARLFDVNATLRLEQTEIYRVPGLRKARRGDVLVFNFPHPNDWSRVEMHILKYYIKRCVALPGDTLSIRNGYFRVSGFDGTLGNPEAQRRISRTRPEDFPDGIYRCFPYDSIIDWNIQDFGPLFIPKAGATVTMDRTAFVLYRKLIEWEQGATLAYRDSTVYLKIIVSGKTITLWRATRGRTRRTRATGGCCRRNTSSDGRHASGVRPTLTRDGSGGNGL